MPLKPHLGLLCTLLPFAAGAATPYVELRAYPAGGIASAGVLFPRGSHLELGISALYNRAERGDAGKHDDESGDGVGIGIEARRYHRSARTGWFHGARAEMFRLDIDWRDAGNRRGNSEITVLQPTARIGYRFAPIRPGASLELAAGLGAEINLETDGEKVGEGAIGLVGVALRFD
ncbi:MAG: hypothetical protein Q7J29_00550 [Stagnimonas sp.]|nr:hypothetical protein [Stagnimonas sp.]